MATSRLAGDVALCLRQLEWVADLDTIGPTAGGGPSPVRALVTAAGRRTTLVSLFREATEATGGSVLAADADPLAPSLFVANGWRQLPKLDHPEYQDDLARMVENDGIGLIVPTIDPELPILAGLRDQMAGHGCTVLVSEADLIAVVADKLTTSRVFGDRGFRVPRTWPASALPRDLPSDLFVKPRWGSGSIGASRCTREDVLGRLGSLDGQVVQEFVDAQEVTIDCLLGLDGEPIHYVPRLRLRTLAGESIQAQTIDDDELRPWLLRLMATLQSMGGRGPMTAQAFLTEGEPTLSEVNARFGGGFPLADAAGGRYPRWLVSAVAGEKLVPRLGEYERGLLMTRTFTEHYLRAPAW